MTAVTVARETIAAAVATTGIDCAAYPPDSLTPPAAFIDTLTVEWDAAQSYCAAGRGEATVLTVGNRNDRAGATAHLEGLIPAIVFALENIDGVRVTSAASGSADVAGQQLPAVSYQLNFALRSE